MEYEKTSTKIFLNFNLLNYPKPISEDLNAKNRFIRGDIEGYILPKLVLYLSVTIPSLVSNQKLQS